MRTGTAELHVVSGYRPGEAGVRRDEPLARTVDSVLQLAEDKSEYVASILSWREAEAWRLGAASRGRSWARSRGCRRPGGWPARRRSRLPVAAPPGPIRTRPKADPAVPGTMWM